LPKNEARLNRINEELKKELSTVLNYELKNPNVTGMLSVTKVKITPDFKYAKVYVSLLNSKNINKTMEGLKESSGFIRSRLAKTVNLRITPELVFEIDDSLEYGARIDSILKDLNISKEESDNKEEE
jgi:ribosome-binding factor A